MRRSDSNQQAVAKLWDRATAAERRGDLSGAKRLYQRVTETFPEHAPAYQRLGLIALSEGQLVEAESSFRRALVSAPTDAVCLNNLGNVLREQGRMADAVSAYEEALALDPDNSNALYNLAGTFSLLGHYSRAADTYREFLRREPEDAQAWNALALTLLDSGDEIQAQSALEEALRLEPDSAERLNHLGVLHQYRGDLEEAGRLFQASIAVDPAYVRAYDNLVRTRKMTQADGALIEAIEKLAVAPSRDAGSRLIARFALGKIYDDCGDYDRAFEHYAIGNALMHGMIRFDAEEHSAWVDRVVKAYDPGFFRAHADEGDSTERPIFVIGMVRSGTTLVEQILASHSHVFGAGELSEIVGLVSDLPHVLGSKEPYPGCVRQLDARIIRAAAQHYIRTLEDHDDRALRVVDKLPTNFLHLGFITTLFPRAHIVHCRRAPLDVCVSIYFQRFARGHAYAYDLDDIAAYYAEYERLMRHWKKVLPVEILEVQYERLLDAQESESRRLLSFCGLEWEEACLTFHTNARPVRTASSWQVRQPLYGTARERWRNFERHLDGLKSALSARSIDWSQ